jgi:hypothetical protein
VRAAFAGRLYGGGPTTDRIPLTALCLYLRRFNDLLSLSVAFW